MAQVRLCPAQWPHGSPNSHATGPVALSTGPWTSPWRAVPGCLQQSCCCLPLLGGSDISSQFWAFPRVGLGPIQGPPTERTQQVMHGGNPSPHCQGGGRALLGGQAVGSRRSYFWCCHEDLLGQAPSNEAAVLSGSGHRALLGTSRDVTQAGTSNGHESPGKQVLVSALCPNLETEAQRLSDLPKVTELGCQKLGFAPKQGLSHVSPGRAAAWPPGPQTGDR